MKLLSKPKSAYQLNTNFNTYVFSSDILTLFLIDWKKGAVIIKRIIYLIESEQRKIDVLIKLLVCSNVSNILQSRNVDLNPS